MVIKYNFKEFEKQIESFVRFQLDLGGIVCLQGEGRTWSLYSASKTDRADFTDWMSFPCGNYMFIVNNKNIRTKFEICSKLTKTPERRQWRHSGIFIVNVEHISHLVLVFLLLTWSR